MALPFAVVVAAASMDAKAAQLLHTKCSSATLSQKFDRVLKASTYP